MTDTRAVRTRTRGTRVRRPANSLVTDAIHPDAAVPAADSAVLDIAALDSEMNVATELLLRARVMPA